jgi:hypothetical protein
MPKRLLRLLVLFALVLTIPVQGVAAATAGVCMALGHHDAVQMDHGGDADHYGDADHHHGADHGGKSQEGPHCPPCVSCCAAAAITSFFPPFVPERSAVSALAPLPRFFSGVTPERLDRPPLPL